MPWVQGTSLAPTWPRIWKVTPRSLGPKADGWLQVCIKRHGGLTVELMTVGGLSYSLCVTLKE